MTNWGRRVWKISYKRCSQIALWELWDWVFLELDPLLYQSLLKWTTLAYFIKFCCFLWNLYNVDLKITAWLEDLTVTEGLWEEEEALRKTIWSCGWFVFFKHTFSQTNLTGCGTHQSCHLKKGKGLSLAVPRLYCEHMVPGDTLALLGENIKNWKWKRVNENHRGAIKWPIKRLYRGV